jgi:hypothetical protein
MVGAAAKLFEHGMADPRGCEYRSVTLRSQVHSNSDSEPVKTHAWVLPANAGVGRYAVCWDGLVYAISEVGAPADLAADVHAAVERHHDAIGEDNPAVNERQSNLAQQAVLPAKHDTWLADTAVALLLRLGEGEKASELWTASRLALEPKEMQHPYLTLVEAWTSKTHDRGQNAHVRGNDRVAMACLQLLEVADSAIESEAKLRGWKFEGNGNKQLFRYQEQLPQLLADQRRRAANGPHKPIVCVGAGRHPDPSVRIPALIDRLEEVTGSQWSWGGDWTSNPVVQSLIHEGDAAIAPLLTCLKSDNRLTRSTQCYRHVPWQECVAGVSQPVMTVLRQSDFYPTLSYDRPREPLTDELIDAIRARIARPEAKRPLAERWFYRLADDTAGPDEWRRAAETLVEKEGTNFWGYGYVGGWEQLYQANRTWSGETGKHLGEPLRKKTGPSVSELMAKRMGQMPDAKSAAPFALSLAEWDAPAARPLLGQLSARCRDAGMGDAFLKLVGHRIDAGDRAALDDYGVWVAKVKPEELSRIRDPFELLIKHADHPAVAKAADQLFGNQNSPWRPCPIGENANHAWLSTLRSPGLLRYSSYRAAIHDLLGDKTTAGTVSVGSRQIMISMANRGEGHSANSSDAPEEYEGSFRSCDYVAYSLSEAIAAAPRFELYWPEAKRNKALTDFVAFLRDYGSRAANDESTTGGLSFLVRDRPASPAEVARHEAIFSLESIGPTRVVKLLRLPIAANWTTLRETPIEANVFKDGKWIAEKRFLQNGFVWQAEEVQVDGRWQRYYGFAGSHHIARVAAEEIEFPDEDNQRPWLRYAGTFEARIAPPKGTVDPDQIGPPRRSVGETVPVPLTVRNAGGLSAAIPNLTGRACLRVWYSPAVIAPQGMLVPSANNKADWEEIKINAGVPFPDMAGRSLEPAAEMLSGEIDLAKWFRLSRPGFYGVQLIATKSPAAAANESIIFSLGAPPKS